MALIHSIAQPSAAIKIIRVIARLNVGGPTTHVKVLCHGLSKYGYESVLVSGSAEKNELEMGELFQKDASSQNYKEIHLGAMKRSLSFFGDLVSFFRLISIFIREKPMIVHTHTAKAGMLGRVAAVIAGVPIRVHTFHGHVLTGYFSAPVSKGFVLIEKVLAAFSTKLVTLSDSLVTELSEKFKLAHLDKFKVIPLGRDLDHFQKTKRYVGSLRRELGLGSEHFLIGTLGRLVPIKNQAMMIEALSLVQNKKVVLILVGDGELKPTLELLAKSCGVFDRVKFLGWRSDLAQLYSDFDLTLMTSFNEGTPLSIIESFAAGCPVISTKVGGVNDLFSVIPQASQEQMQKAKPKSEDNVLTSVLERQEGWLLTRFETQPLADLIEALVENRTQNNKILSDKSERCRDRGAFFSEENLIKNMNDFYLELLKEKSL